MFARRTRLGWDAWGDEVAALSEWSYVCPVCSARPQSRPERANRREAVDAFIRDQLPSLLAEAWRVDGEEEDWGTSTRHQAELLGRQDRGTSRKAMTTHRNLKPHYAERQSARAARSCVVKTGEVMSEPTTEAGRILLLEHSSHEVRTMARHIVAVEQEARANADRELRELRAFVKKVAFNMQAPTALRSEAVEISERKS
jgi:hypothetical protein